MLNNISSGLFHGCTITALGTVNDTKCYRQILTFDR